MAALLLSATKKPGQQASVDSVSRFRHLSLPSLVMLERVHLLSELDGYPCYRSLALDAHSPR